MHFPSEKKTKNYYSYALQASASVHSQDRTNATDAATCAVNVLAIGAVSLGVGMVRMGSNCFQFYCHFCSVNNKDIEDEDDQEE